MFVDSANYNMKSVEKRNWCINNPLDIWKKNINESEWKKVNLFHIRSMKTRLRLKILFNIIASSEFVNALFKQTSFLPAIMKWIASSAL